MTRAPLRDRRAYPVWIELGTRWTDNDIYGHVNNSAYYGWFDTAVNSWLIDASLLRLDTPEVIGLVVESGCRYAQSLAYPDRVEIGLAVDRLGISSVAYRLGAFAKYAASAAAEGTFVHVYVDAETRRPVPLPDRWRCALVALEQESA